MKNYKVFSVATVVVSSLMYSVGCKYDPDLEITKKVKSIITTKLNVEVDSVRLNSKLIQNLSTDSLDAVEICMEIEKEFNISIDDKDWEAIKTVNDIVIVVKKHTKYKR